LESKLGTEYCHKSNLFTIYILLQLYQLYSAFGKSLCI